MISLSDYTSPSAGVVLKMNENMGCFLGWVWQRSLSDGQYGERMQLPSSGSGPGTVVFLIFLFYSSQGQPEWQAINLCDAICLENLPGHK